MSIALQSITQEQTDKVLKENVIRASESPWSSPILLVKKKNTNGDVASIFEK